MNRQPTFQRNNFEDESQQFQTNSQFGSHDKVTENNGLMSDRHYDMNNMNRMSRSFNENRRNTEHYADHFNSRDHHFQGQNPFFQQ